MNAVVSTPIDEMTSSTADAVSVAREKLKEATAALDRARVVSEAATDALHAQEKDDDAAIAQHKERLQRWVLQGHSGSPPALVIDVNRAQAKVTAQATTRAAAENVTHFEALEADARAVLTAAQDAHNAYHDVQRCRETDRIAVRLIELRKEEFDLCALLAIAHQDGMMSGRQLISTGALLALNHPPRRPNDETFYHVEGMKVGGYALDFDTPINGNVSWINAARNYWDKLA